MNKRDFLKSMVLTSMASPFLMANIGDWIDELPIEDNDLLSSDEDFWNKVRSDYKLKPDYINLESGYYNIIPTPTFEAYTAHAAMVNYEGSYYMRTVQWENKRRMNEKLAKVAGCDPGNLIITRNTTESLDMVIKGMDWKPGDEAVYAEQDYGAMKEMFKQVSRRFGVVSKVVSVPLHPKSDEEIVSLYENAITPKTKLLMVCHMINITGQILPIRKICDMAHRYGVQVMVDGAHCIGHFQFSIRDLNCDYYGSSLHKWLAVPLGTGLLYVADDHIDTLWPLLAEHDRPKGDISRLNHTGTHPVHHDLSIENAIDYYNMLGAGRKEERLRYLQHYWTAKVRNIDGVIINTPEASGRSCGIANVGIEGMHPKDLEKKLMDDYKIFTVAINGSGVHGCRITPNVFTLSRELDVLVKAITSLV